MHGKLGTHNPTPVHSWKVIIIIIIIIIIRFIKSDVTLAECIGKVKGKI